MELGFGSLRGQLASLVAEKAQEVSKRKDAEEECARQSAKRVRLEQGQAALLADAEQRTGSAQSELRVLRTAYEQLRSEHDQEREQREIAQEQLKSSVENAKKVAAELTVSQAAARTVSAKLSQAEVQSTGFSHAAKSFEQNYNTVQQQITQIRTSAEKYTEQLKELQKTNSSLVEALHVSDAELSGYRDRDNAGAKAIDQAVEDKEAAQRLVAEGEAQISRLKRELELEKELNERNRITMREVESERAHILQLVAEYDQISPLQESGVEAAESSGKENSQVTLGSEETDTCRKEDTASAKVTSADVSDASDDTSIDVIVTSSDNNIGGPDASDTMIEKRPTSDTIAESDSTNAQTTDELPKNELSVTTPGA